MSDIQTAGTVDDNERGFEQLQAIIRKLTKPQRKMLDNFATGGNYGRPEKVMLALVARGLVVYHERTKRDRLGLFSWNEYELPIPVHMAWAAVGEEEFDALSPEERAALEAPEL